MMGSTSYSIRPQHVSKTPYNYKVKESVKECGFFFIRFKDFLIGKFNK